VEVTGLQDGCTDGVHGTLRNQFGHVSTVTRMRGYVAPTRPGEPSQFNLDISSELAPSLSAAMMSLPVLPATEDWAEPSDSESPTQLNSSSGS